MNLNKKNYAEKKLSKIEVETVVKEQFEELISSLQKNLAKFKEINAVVLFGSFAREDYSIRHSDLDVMVFLDEAEENKALEEKIRERIINLNLGKEISVHTVFQYKKIGEEDKSLMLTIAKEGRVVFARSSLVISKNLLGLGEYFLLKFETAGVNPVVKNKLQRFLHGYKVGGKKYQGIVDEEKVFSAGKGAIIVPGEMLKKILLFVQGIGVKAIQKGKFYK